MTVPEAQVDAFGQDHVPPVVGTFEDAVTGKTIHYWTKPIDGVVIKTLALENAIIALFWSYPTFF